MPTNGFSHPNINKSGTYRVRYCRNCGAPLTDGAAFCGKCGTRYEDVRQKGTNSSTAASADNYRVRYCRNCGAPLTDGACFCGKCGTRYEAAQRQPSNTDSQRGQASQSYTGGGNLGGGYVNNSYSGGNSGGAGYTYNARSGNVGDYSRLSVDPDAALNILLRKMKTSRTIWIVLSIYMIIVGIATAFAGYGFFPIGLAIWNLYQCSRNKKTADQWERTPVGIVSAYETDKIVPIIMVFINLIFGAFFGMIGSIYNLSINHYVIDHKDAFYELERRAGRYV